MAAATCSSVDLQAILAAGDAFGRSDAGAGARLQVEFVSAYPTGPLTILHGRSAAVGDALANLFDWTGCEVERESYINDAGEQIERLARSVAACYLELAGRPGARPEDGYPAEVVEPLALAAREREGNRLVDLAPADRQRALVQFLREEVVRQQRETLDHFGVRFDRWYSERELHGGAIEEAVEQLRRSGSVYEEDGALWLGSSRLGDEQDRPLVRSNGVPTYIAADIAYHLDKQRRGFRRVVDVWGPDHNGYVARTRAGLKALGIDPGWLEVVILGPVSLKVDGLRVEGSNQKSHAVMLKEMIEDLGAPAARLAYLERPAGAPLELDLDLARRQSADSSAHRILSALQSAGRLAGGAARRRSTAGAAPVPRAAHEEIERRLLRFPEEVRAAAAELEPYRLFRFTLDLAARVEDVTAPRAAAEAKNVRPEVPAELAEASRIVLRNALRILGVSAPE